MPGLHAPETGDHRVVWWDPAKLNLGARTASGLVQTRILEADTGGRAEIALREWNEWRETRDRTRERGTMPSRVVRAATEWSRDVARAAAAGVSPAAAGVSPTAAPFTKRALSTVEVIEVGGTGHAGRPGEFGSERSCMPSSRPSI
jgi:hypothetical protein